MMTFILGLNAEVGIKTLKKSNCCSSYQLSGQFDFQKPQRKGRARKIGRKVGFQKERKSEIMN